MQINANNAEPAATGLSSSAAQHPAARRAACVVSIASWQRKLAAAAQSVVDDASIAAHAIEGRWDAR